jgi:OOP family OmpA-OmpF porin
MTPARRSARLAAALCALAAAALCALAPARAAEEASCLGKARLRGSAFEEGSARIQPAELPVLELVAQAMNGTCAGKAITIEGHVRASGEPGRDQQLSLARAEEVRRQLVQRGVAGERLRAVGFGSTRPQSTDPAQGDLDERITFVVEGE